jgi:hypothetical protein
MNFIDIDFPPTDTSIFKELEGSAPDILVHWRRP